MLTKLAGGYKNKVAKLENEGKTYVAIFFDIGNDDADKLSYIHSLVDPLLKDSLPVRVNLDFVENPKQNVLIFNYLPGKTIPWDGYTMNHIKLTGMAMSNMHFLLKDELEEYEDAVKIQTGKVYEMDKYFKDAGVILGMKEKLNIRMNWDFKKYLELFKDFKTLPSQLLHLDLVRGNLLFANKEELILENPDIFNGGKNNFLTIDSSLYLTGILDFEKVAYGPRIFDIARTLSFLIVDCKYKKEEKIRKYFLESGYDKRGKMKLPDLKYLNSLMEYFWLYDFFKFLYYTPYESLRENEHFVRTLNELTKRDLILAK
ncbi:MAG: hypothetical protein WCK31_00065 [bacterium]